MTRSPPPGRGEGERPVVRLGDALDDGQPEADSRVVGADAFGAALERLGERGDQLRASSSPVFSTASTTLRADVGLDPHGAALGEIVDDRVVHEVGGQLQQQRV